MCSMCWLWIDLIPLLNHKVRAESIQEGENMIKLNGGEGRSSLQHKMSKLSPYSYWVIKYIWSQIIAKTWFVCEPSECCMSNNKKVNWAKPDLLSALVFGDGSCWSDYIYSTISQRFEIEVFLKNVLIRLTCPANDDGKGAQWFISCLHLLRRAVKFFVKVSRKERVTSIPKCLKPFWPFKGEKARRKCICFRI